MKKVIYLVSAMILSFAMMLSLASCADKDSGNDNENENGDKTEKVTYTVTAVDGEGTPVRGVKVEFTMDNGTPVPYTTDAQGKITFATAKEVSAKLISIPTGYTCDLLNKKITFDADGNANITLEAEEVKLFTVKVVDQDGNAVEGVKVQICDAAGSCRTPQLTDENGEAFYKFEDGTFYASFTNGITAIPEGYTVADPDAKYYLVGDSVTIEIEKLN